MKAIVLSLFFLGLVSSVKIQKSDNPNLLYDGPVVEQLFYSVTEAQLPAWLKANKETWTEFLSKK